MISGTGDTTRSAGSGASSRITLALASFTSGRKPTATFSPGGSSSLKHDASYEAFGRCIGGPRWPTTTLCFGAVPNVAGDAALIDLKRIIAGERRLDELDVLFESILASHAYSYRVKRIRLRYLAAQ